MTTSVLLKVQLLGTSSPREGHRDPEGTGLEAEAEDRSQITGKSTLQACFGKGFLGVLFLLNEFIE